MSKELRAGWKRRRQALTGWGGCGDPRHRWYEAPQFDEPHSPAIPMLKTCPKCAAENPADAFLCSCGYEFGGDEPRHPAPPAMRPPPPRFPRLPVFVSSIICTLVLTLVVVSIYGARMRHFEPEWIAIPIALAFAGFLSIFFCVRILRSPTINWGIKVLSLLLVAFGLVLVVVSVIFGGCATGAIRGINGRLQLPTPFARELPIS